MSDDTARPTPSWSELEQYAVSACHAGAGVVLPILGSARALSTKSSPTDVVTDTDLASERSILAYLDDVTPAATVLAEESGRSTGTTETDRTLEWVVDPLDGTVNFLYGLGAVAISVAAVVDGVIVAGAVLDATNGEVFSASKGGGARGQGVEIHVSDRDDLAQSMLATGYSYDATHRRKHGSMIAEMLGVVRDIRCFGSSALHLCWIASGRLDAYLERDTKPWDWAAGSLIAAEAGATIELPCAENADLVMATAPAIFEPLRRLVLHADRASAE